jgi:hypothetical protein
VSIFESSACRIAATTYEPRQRAGKARVVSSADQPAAMTNKQLDL